LGSIFRNNYRGNITLIMRISQKIWISISLLITGYMVSIFIIFVSGDRMEQQLHLASSALAPAAQNIQEVSAWFEHEIEQYEEAYTLDSPDSLNIAVEKAKIIETTLGEIAELPLPPEKRDEVIKLQAGMKAFSDKAVHAYKDVLSRLDMAEGADNADRLRSEFDRQFFEFGKQTNEYRKKLLELRLDFAESLTRELVSAENGNRKQRHLNLAICLAIQFFSVIVINLLISKSIIKPIGNIIKDLNSSAGRIANAAVHVMTTSKAVADGASVQLAAIEETSVALDEISTTSRNNAGSAGQANHFIKDNDAIIRQCSDMISDLTRSMSEISDSSQYISRIVKTIDEIAFQTNLLALNAAVESARAGEAGSGFAVVADEVRNLARRSADAAKNTSALIEETVTKIGKGAEIVSRTETAFGDVKENARKVSVFIHEISDFSQEQARSVEQVFKAVTEISQVAQRNASNIENATDVSGEMKRQSEKLNEYVVRLLRLVGKKFA